MRENRYACENVNKLLVGNKSDLEAKRAVTTEEAKVCIIESGCDQPSGTRYRGHVYHLELLNHLSAIQLADCRNPHSTSTEQPTCI